MDWQFHIIPADDAELLTSFMDQRQVIFDHFRKIMAQAPSRFIDKTLLYELDLVRTLLRERKRTFVMDCFIAFANEHGPYEVGIDASSDHWIDIIDDIAFDGATDTFAAHGFSPSGIIFYTYVPSGALSNGMHRRGCYNFWCTVEEDAVLLKLLLS